MKHLGILALLLLLLTTFGALAQNLTAVLVSDTFDAGSRGNNIGSGTYGASNPDGSEYLDISNVDGVTGTIRYINSWAGASNPPSEIESPVIDVTVANDNPDWNLVGAIEAIAANPFDSASPTRAVLIGDDGGFNALFLGESDDNNYFIQADVYCQDRTSEGTGFYEAVSVCYRAGRDNDPNLNEYTFNMDREGSYSLTYDAQLGTVSARKWTVGNPVADITARTAGTFTEFASQALAEGWHTFKIDGFGNVISFSVDGTEIANVTDSDFSTGRPGLVYREASIASADESQGKFDRLVAGPATAPTVLGVSGYELYR